MEERRLETLETQPEAELSARSNLTRSQFLIWMGQQLHPEAALYNMIQTFRIQGALDPDRFCASFQALVNRSDALRTVIEVQDGVPNQRVLPEMAQAVEYLDFSSLDDPNGAYLAWQEERRARLFELDRRLFDSALIRLGEERFVWYLAQHHLITDGWSFMLVYKETARLYGQAQDGGQDPAPTLPAYESYAAYERENRRSGALSFSDAYWRQKLDAAPEPVSFYGRQNTRQHARSERVIFELGKERSERLKEMAGQPGIRSLNGDLSLFGILAAVYAVFIHRISGSQEVTFGAPFHNRPTPSFKETIGLFIEIFPLRVQIDEKETFNSLLKKVTAETFQVLRHAQPGASSAAHNRAYQALLNFVNVTFPPFAGLPVEVDWVHSGYGDSNHSLRLQIHDFNATGSYTLHFDFNCDVFGAEERRWAVQHFVRILDCFLDNQHGSIHDFNLLSDVEEAAYVHTFNHTGQPYPDGQTVVALFEAQVERTPQAAAVVCGEQSLTYTQLNQRANQLAHHLQRLGVGPESLVALCMEHGVETVAALLGILKAGGAYVPLDPAYPPERLAVMLADMGQTNLVVVTQPWLASILQRAAPGPMTIVALDPGWTEIAGQCQENLPPTAGPGSLVYMIYTSGSTGKPKGVQIEHRGLVNYLCWAQKTYFYDEPLDFAFFSSLSFDLTVTSIYLPLISGSKVLVYHEPRGSQGAAILQVIEDNQAGIVKLTPAHLSLLKEMDMSRSRIRRLIVGGEDFKTGLARHIHKAFGREVELYNEYGPTETVVGCMIHRFDPRADLGLSVPVGTPADNTQIYVLDAHQNPTPSGVVGEMYIGGDGVARGYLNRPELNAGKFLPNPFRPGERMYRSGDLARWESTGRLTFLGRADDQVKLNGFRIELGEIEAHLRQLPGVTDGVVEVTVPKKPTKAPAAEQYCTRCGLASSYPGVEFDAAGVCSLCTAYESYRNQAQPYFKSMSELETLLAQVKATKAGEYDCLVLFSGGKDSTYMLCRLAEMGLRVLSFTLDNGFISDQAKENIRRITTQLGVDHQFGSTPAMNAIFVDSLKHHSNVCNGCFKTIYTLAVNLAREKQIGCIVTGLSRGQFFETRLTEDLFRQQNFDLAAIDHSILEARKAYHRRQDLISRSLDVDVFRDDAVFQDVIFVDFYRYCDAPLDEMYAYIENKVGWLRPADTGRSTNCLINDVGIFVHKKQRGYHNYALPYSWDVRLGHKTRQAAIEELQDDIDEARVKKILAEIGYQEPPESPQFASPQLIAYVVADNLPTPEDLRRSLAQSLPEHMIPTRFIRLDRLPLTQNGKVDRQALPPVEASHPPTAGYAAPATPVEQKLAEIWRQALHLEQVGVEDNFLSLGGASLPAIQIVARTSQAFGIQLPIHRFFENPTIAQLSGVVEELLIAEIEKLSEEEAQELLQGLTG